MVLTCHVISQGYTVKVSCDFIGRSPSSPKHSGSGDIMVSIGHVIFQESIKCIYC